MTRNVHNYFHANYNYNNPFFGFFPRQIATAVTLKIPSSLPKGLFASPAR